MPIVNPKVKNLGNDTYHYELPMALPKDADSPPYPFAGQLEVLSGGVLVVVDIENGKQIRIPEYINHVDHALKYIMSICSAFLRGYSSGQGAAT